MAKTKIENELKDMCQQCWHSPCVCAKLDKFAEDLKNNKPKGTDVPISNLYKNKKDEQKPI